MSIYWIIILALLCVYAVGAVWAYITVRTWRNGKFKAVLLWPILVLVGLFGVAP